MSVGDRLFGRWGSFGWPCCDRLYGDSISFVWRWRSFIWPLEFDHLYGPWRSFVWPLEINCMTVGYRLFGSWRSFVWPFLDRLYGRWR